MNLLCPNCQKMLTIGDQYAGQLMKCPCCSGTFTVPTLEVEHSAGLALIAALVTFLLILGGIAIIFL